MQLVRTGKPVRYRIRSGSLAVIAAMLAVMAPMTASAAVLDRVRETGKLILGYEPMRGRSSYADEAGKPSGYAVALCEKVADEVKAELGLCHADIGMGSDHGGRTHSRPCSKERSTFSAVRPPSP